MLLYAEYLIHTFVSKGGVLNMFNIIGTVPLPDFVVLVDDFISFKTFSKYTNKFNHKVIYIKHNYCRER